MSTQVLEPESENLPKTHYARQKFSVIVLILVVGNISGTLTGPDWIAKIPLQNILKNSLHVSREDTAKFFFWCTFFFFLKPIAGILTDAFPLFRTRRRYYLLFSSGLAAISWIALSFVPKTYSLLLIGVMVVNLFVMMMSTVSGAFLVEVGQSRQELGKLSSVRQVTRSACGLIQGPVGGLLAKAPFFIVTAIGTLSALSIFPIAFFFLKEEPSQKNPDVLRNASRQLSTMFRSKPFWLTLGFIFLIQFTPGLGTMTYFRQNDVLHLSQQTIGFLGAGAGVAGMLSASSYYFLAKRLKLRQSMVIAVVATAVASLGYLFYDSLPLAFGIDFISGLAGGFTFTVLLDTAGRGTPAGCEGLGYSLLMSVANFAGAGADWVGSHIADQYHVSWNAMVCINAGTTLVVLFLLPFMPRQIMDGRDRENVDSNLPNLEA